MSFNRRPPRISGESSIIKRRIREDQLATSAKNVKNMKSMNSRAEWEDRLHHDTQKKRVNQIFQVLQNQDETELFQRKKRLADLYNREIEQWKYECAQNIETPEQRKMKMMLRARNLKEKREQERLQLVREKRLQQYRNACDDVRSIDSERASKAAADIRLNQIEEKKRLEEEERKFEQKMASLWEEDRQMKIKRENQIIQRIHDQNQQVKNILDLQVDLSRKRVEEEVEEKSREDQELLKLWKSQEKMEKEREHQRKLDEIKRASEVKVFNKERAEIQKQEKERELEYDMKLLELALKREADADAREKELQEQFKREQIEYQDMLKKQMEIEAEDLSYLDEIRTRMENEVWEKRDAQHNKEAAARRALLEQVLKSREEQIRMKQGRRIQQRKEDEAYIQRTKEEADEALQKELREQEARLKASKEHQCRIRQQMEYRRMENNKRLQEEALEAKRMQYEEKMHQQRVKAITQQVPTIQHRRKAAEWYFDS